MNATFIQTIFKAHQTCKNCPTPHQVSSFFEALLAALFPNYSSVPVASPEALEELFVSLREEALALMQNKEIVDRFFEELPHLYGQLQQDVDAIYSGDPAAVDREEVIRAYPGFYAIAAYRVAHHLHLQKVPSIPRSITEHAHSKTGIDIHPGATIGTRFCIDHGTGIVIGETTIIGNDVKIYQGVTLGALSVEKSLANSKRHPTIEDGVVIYSGATVLGGNTVIGHASVIGGNVWLTKSVPARSKVYYKTNMELELIIDN